MNFEEWNKLIAENLFNSTKKTQNVFLCLTEEDIKNLYKQKFGNDKSNDFIWKDFCNAIKEGTSRGYRKHLIDKLQDAIEQIKDDKPIYPYYISYLLFLTLPLVKENDDNKFSAKAYYPKLKKFLLDNLGNDYVNEDDFRKIVTPCWEKLETWANKIKRGELGIFNNINRSGSREHVDKIFSQVILTPTLKNKLPDIFRRGRPYFENLTLFQNQFFDFLKIPKNADFLWNTASDLIEAEYREYINGEPIPYKKSATVSMPKPPQRLLQIDINRNNGTCKLFYREKLDNEYFDKEKLEERDTFFPKPVYFFVQCYCIGLSGGIIETNKLLKKEQMYLLCKDNTKQNYEKCFANFELIKLSGLPEDYLLYKVSGIEKTIDGLEISEDKSIEFFDGLEIGYKNFAYDYLPKIKICNGDISDKVYLECNGKRIDLNKKEDYWELPNNIPLNTDFKVKIENEKINNDEQNYYINSTTKTCLKLNNYVDATILKENDNLRNDTHIRGKNVTIISCNSSIEFIPSEADYFISYLSLLEKMHINKFDKIFSFFRGYFDKTERKTTVHLLESLCFIDYDYKTKHIDALAPEFILIPTLNNCSRSALLIGCRDITFVKKIIEKSKEYGLQIIIKKQHNCNNKYLLPNAIIINAFGDEKNNYGENNIAKFAEAEDIGVPFKDKDFLFIKILEQQCDNLSDYEKNIKPSEINFDDFETPKIFNLETLRFEESENSMIDKDISLIEYETRYGQCIYVFWYKKIHYEIDKSLGRYLFLWKKNRHIIFRSGVPYGIAGNKEKFAIPMKCPLLKYMNRNLILMNGIAPLEHFERTLNRKFYIYDEIPDGNLFKKLCQKPKENTKWIP